MSKAIPDKPTPYEFKDIVYVLDEMDTRLCTFCKKDKNGICRCTNEKLTDLCIDNMCKIKDKLQIDYDICTRERFWYTTIPFGKYTGKTIKEVFKDDPEYLLWLCKLDKTYGELRDSLEYLVLDIINKCESNKREYTEMISEIF